MKEIHPEHVGDAVVLEQFRREVELWIALGNHPNIVNVQNVSLNSETHAPFFLMEYVAPDDAGRVTLADHMQGSPAWPRIARWIVQCCDGLAFAESNGIRCHRDLKPGNILITQNGTAKVGDFGLAVFNGLGRAARQRGGIEKTVVGSPWYMAPEQFQDPLATDARSDVYALGVILYEIAAGRLPFVPSGADHGYWSWLDAHCNQAPPPITFSALWPIIERCLAKRQSDRYQSYSDLRVALNTRLVEVGHPHVARAQNVAETASDWNNRGGGLKSLGRPEEALTCFRQAVLMDPSFAKGWSNLGACLLDLGHAEESVQCYDRALSIDATLGFAWIAKGNQHYVDKQFANALLCYDRAIGGEPTNAAAWNNRAFALADLERWPEAIQSVSEASRLDPESTWTRMHLGDILSRSGAHLDAIAVYDGILQRNPDPVIYTKQGHEQRLLKDLDGALSSFRTALELDDNCAGAHYGLGLATAAQRDFPAAAQHLSQAVRCDARDAPSWHAYGDVQRELGLVQDAVESYRRVVDLAPENWAAWADGGACLHMLGKMGEAHVHMREALRLNPLDWRTWWNRAALEARLGLLDNAAESYRRFLLAVPHDITDGIQYANEWIAAHVLSGPR